MPSSPGGTFSARVILVNGITTVADETLAPSLVPEPATCGLLLLGMAGAAAVRRGRS
ncbi:PEP-CTERM sorting domain-containing protein [Lacipirellula sp.]|uniref:PEP-CTERM sorting domain-containing protein n=1 Tax=Lacipirellula sp. TaxID=2691419 RepID=UPI003D0F79D2